MSQGGSIKNQIKDVEEKLEAEIARWNENNLPHIGNAYRLNDNEFMHHVHTLAHTKLLVEHLGITEEQVELATKQVWLEEMTTFFDIIMKARSDQALSKLLLPPGMNNGPIVGN